MVCLLLAVFAPARAQPANVPASDGRELVVGTKVAPPFAMKAEDGTWTGISIELWRRLADDLHLRYRFHETTLQGLIDETAAGSLDLAIAAITVTSEREREVDFSQPFFSTGLGIAVPNASKFNWWRLLGSFLSIGFVEALLALVAVTIGVGVIVWLLERRHSEHFGGVRKGLVTGVWWSALTMTQAGAEHAPVTLPGRLIAVGWMGASVMAIAVFTAGITSQLTAKQLQGSVHSVADLRRARTGVLGGTASLDYLAGREINFHSYATVKDGLDALQAGKLDAFVYDRPILAWYVRRDFSNSLDVLSVTFDKENYAIALPNDSPLRHRINGALLPLLRSHWWEELNAKYLGAE